MMGKIGPHPKKRSLAVLLLPDRMPRVKLQGAPPSNIGMGNLSLLITQSNNSSDNLRVIDVNKMVQTS